MENRKTIRINTDLLFKLYSMNEKDLVEWFKKYNLELEDGRILKEF